jgi:hypothetical protein
MNTGGTGDVGRAKCMTLVRSLGDTSGQSLIARLVLRVLIGCAENISCILCCLVP